MAETIRVALVQFRQAMGLDEYEETRSIWLATLGSLIVPLPNFNWRREAIGLHDAHHLITEYPVTAAGEICLASWELGIGCYEDWRARMLCGFLMSLGLLSQPKKTIAAFNDGRKLAPLYAGYTMRELLEMDLSDAKTIFCPANPGK